MKFEPNWKLYSWIIGFIAAILAGAASVVAGVEALTQGTDPATPAIVLSFALTSALGLLTVAQQYLAKNPPPVDRTHVAALMSLESTIGELHDFLQAFANALPALAQSTTPATQVNVAVTPAPDSAPAVPVEPVPMPDGITDPTQNVAPAPVEEKPMTPMQPVLPLTEDDVRRIAADTIATAFNSALHAGNV